MAARWRARVVAWVVIVASITVATACGSDDAEDDNDSGDEGAGQVGPIGDVLVEVEGAGAIHEGAASNAADLDVGAEGVAPPTDGLPGDVMSLGRGLRVAVSGAPNGPLELRLQLPAEPEGGGMPAALHVRDDGTMAVQPGLYDPATNELVVWTDDFSDWFGGWWNPANWLEETIQVGQGVFDQVADWATGRTDPPACDDGEGQPDWARVATAELASVHVCLQPNEENGDVRAELYLKSNRNTLQLVTLPAGADYVWVQDQPEWMRPILVDAFNVGDLDPVDGDTHVLLVGGKAMSIGFRQPEYDLSIDVLAYRSWPLAVVNPLLGLLGVVGEDAEGIEAMALAAQSCVHGVAGISIQQLDVVPEGYESRADLLQRMAGCSLELVSTPDLAIGTFDEILGEAGMAATTRNQALGRLRNGLDRLQGSASRLLRVLGRARVVANVWDHVFDSLAEGRVTVTMAGRRGPALDRNALLSAPVPSLCELPAGTLVDGALPGVAEGDGGVWLYTLEWPPDDQETAERLSALGDVTGDGRRDAVVTIGCYRGGVGWPDTLHVYTDGPTHLASVPLADAYVTGWEARESVTSVRVSDDGTFQADWLTHVPGDAMCCPSLEVRGTFAVDGDQVVTRSVEVLADDRLAPDIAPGAWPDIDACRTGDVPDNAAGAAGAQQVAMCLYSAFALSESDTAARFAEPQAVDAIFDGVGLLASQDWTFHGCDSWTANEAEFACTFTPPDDAAPTPMVVELVVAPVGDSLRVVSTYAGEDVGD